MFQVHIRPAAARDDPVHIPEAVHRRPAASVRDHGPAVPGGAAPHVPVGGRAAGARGPGHRGHGDAGVRRAQGDRAVPGGRARLRPRRAAAAAARGGRRAPGAARGLHAARRLRGPDGGGRRRRAPAVARLAGRARVLRQRADDGRGRGGRAVRTAGGRRRRRPARVPVLVRPGRRRGGSRAPGPRPEHVRRPAGRVPRDGPAAGAARLRRVPDVPARGRRGRGRGRRRRGRGAGGPALADRRRLFRAGGRRVRAPGRRVPSAVLAVPARGAPRRRRRLPGAGRHAVSPAPARARHGRRHFRRTAQR